MTTQVNTTTRPRFTPSNGGGAPEVAAYDPAWDVAFKCFQQNPQGDIVAIQAVWNAMMPPASLTLLATVVGAIFADVYWTGNQMDVGHLSASLQQAGGWNQSDCDQAAKVAFSNWYGLLVRNDFGSFGQIPKTGGLTASPDVLCNGAGPLDPSLMLGKWNSSFFNAASGTKNFAYGRVQSVNFPLPITQPTLQMYVTDAGFNPPPNSWIQMNTFGNSTSAPMQGLTPGPITLGGRAANGVATTDAFDFQPAGAGHYCLLSMVSTEFFTNNPLQFTGNWNSLMWITYNGAAGWHNLDVQASNEEVLKYYNQDGRPEKFAFEAHCVNVPAGTTVSLKSEDERLASDIESGDVKVTGDYQIVGTEGVVPANFGGELTVRVDTPGGGLLPPRASVQVRMLWVLERGHTYYAQAVKHLGAYSEEAAGQSLRVPMGDYTFVGAAE
jgi:hypothetical protein